MGLTAAGVSGRLRRRAGRLIGFNAAQLVTQHLKSALGETVDLGYEPDDNRDESEN
jgi:hypothetical protein